MAKKWAFDRRSTTERPRKQRLARAITDSMPPYQYRVDERPSIPTWPGPGKGVSGETSN